MRILFLTNFYPPFALGGQGESCRQVVAGMQARGHETMVLTSRHGVENGVGEEFGISRTLHLEMALKPLRNSIDFFTKRKANARQNLRQFDEIGRQFSPDVVFVWGMWNFHRSLPAYMETVCAGKVAYRFAEYWPTLPSQYEYYWKKPGRKWHSRIVKKMMGTVALRMLAQEKQPPPLKFKQVMCVSAGTRNELLNAGIPVSQARIIHTGLNPEQFVNHAKNHRNSDSQLIKLLYAGRFSQEKGVETLIRALAKLIFEMGITNIQLQMAGSGTAEYDNRLRQLVAEAGLGEFVTFLGRLPSEEMPALYQQSDILLVPSIWPEPFARVILEGMVSGLTVIATPTGGSAEIVRDGENGLLFKADDADELAQKIAGIVRDPDRRYRLVNAGRETVLTHFTLDKMMDKIENFLSDTTHKAAV